MDSDFPRCDHKSQCKWSLNKGNGNAVDPHRHVRQKRVETVMPNILSHIGNTPMVELKKLPAKYGIKCRMLAKCEFFNPGGSVKDRIALRMIEDAEEKGLIKPGWTLIEPTSGNTGIGLAMASAIKGYRCIIVMPEKMSMEKANTLRALGAEIIRTPTSAKFDAPDSIIVVAQKICKSIPNSIILDQYINPGNPLAHYDTTAVEIIEQCEKSVDAVVLGAGTCGTLTGIGRRIKESLPNCKIIGVDPVGSILAHNENEDIQTAFYEIEGIGYDFYPTVYDRTIVDKWIKTKDCDSFIVARDLIRLEGLLCGGSSGSAMWAGLQVAKDMKEGETCVVILPDSIRNYMSKFLDDSWMIERNFLTNDLIKDLEENKPWYWDLSISTIPNINSGLLTVRRTATVEEVLSLIKRLGIDQVPVIDDINILHGVVTVSNMMKLLVSGRAKRSDQINKYISTNFPSVKSDDNIGKLTTMLKTNSFVVVVEQTDQGKRVLGIITHVDILDYLVQKD